MTAANVGATCTVVMKYVFFYDTVTIEKKSIYFTRVLSSKAIGTHFGFEQ